MMRILYLDCVSGISGDMFIGALIDAGADPAGLEQQLHKLSIAQEYELQWRKVIKNGITATKFDVHLLEQEHSHQHSHDHSHDHTHSDSHDHSHDHTHSHNHDHSHDHAHSHSHDHSHDHTHSHSHDHAHSHSHDHSHDHAHSHSHDLSHSHDHGHHHHDHRSYVDIVRMIEQAGFNGAISSTALDIFKKIGEAEGKIHGQPLNEVHFHEVGAVDSIIDIVGAAILLDQLQIEAVYASRVPVGSGKIRIDHGVYPVPAPATLEILKGVPLEQSTIRGELTTPTGAAIAAVLAKKFGPMPSMTPHSIGYGAGAKNFGEHPNVLRVVIGEMNEPVTK